MKKVLLSLLLIGSVSSVFAQGTPVVMDPKCPIDIKSNQGGGDCGPCLAADRNKPGDDLELPTAVVTLTFRGDLSNCVPRLVRVEDNEDKVREVLCGKGTVKDVRNGLTVIEYCLYRDEQLINETGGGGADNNFFNQPDLFVTLLYPACGTAPSFTIRCDERGQNSPLPVSFRAFTAGRNKANVAVKWTTSTETNNKGFNIQRNTRGVWETVAFVASQASGGNSSSDLIYSYTDANNFGGVSQYRIQQVDIDGRSKISEIRTVRGESQSGRTVVYPNPSNEGSVNVVFDDAKGRRDVIVSDISGRVVKSWKGIVENTLRISNLMPGTYMLRIVNEADGQSSFEKVVINK